MPYLIDGYNLLRAIQRFEEFALFDEVQLCRTVSDFLRCVQSRGHIVFDGIGPPDKRELGGIRGVEVYFSGESLEADDIIEDKIADNSAPKSLVVVSSDRRLRDAAKRRKATSLQAEPFWAFLIAQLEKAEKRPAPEPREKRGGITDQEADLWMDAFGMDDD